MNRILIAISITLALTTGSRSDEQAEKNPAVNLVQFENANSRDTYFTIHNVKAAHVLGKGKGVKIPSFIMTMRRTFCRMD
jgi:hypothetical protein